MLDHVFHRIEAATLETEDEETMTKRKEEEKADDGTREWGRRRGFPRNIQERCSQRIENHRDTNVRL